ncbi:two-component system LytT family response regulator [Luteibacter sp. Sphag1AF]|uniref:LytR/AlgR family response regulator transcription factor n=1 Tax=Luteibacter sp. Sphag1AF TaxID=2587031 RepID=UPI001610722D|nr:LytTR family DNA-binding domain-containing protein [Luteibacter sp. Sphag1AF]MBB3228242.1 two-component system LytT family response regulator [Luteibacter sp. Sphag1AF]
MTIPVLVVDDEPLARRAIVRLLRDQPDMELIGECGDGQSAVEAIRAQSPALVFLDIQMPAMNGMDVVATIGAARMPATVFVTAFEQYAVRAFEANAVDYLVKPFSQNRFVETLARVRKRLSVASTPSHDIAAIQQVLESLRRREDYVSRLPVRTNEQITFVDVTDIVWIKANGNSVDIHTEKQVHSLRETMTALGERLDPKRFARVHRSAIVNIARVKTIHPWFNGYHVITMDTGQQLRMSRYQHEALLKLVSPRSGPAA